LKSQAKLPELLRALEGVIHILNALDDAALWTNDEVLNFFEVRVRYLSLNFKVSMFSLDNGPVEKEFILK
jgi:hypothetical protein